jgi:hypothetical protein
MSVVALVTAGLMLAVGALLAVALRDGAAQAEPAETPEPVAELAAA